MSISEARIADKEGEIAKAIELYERTIRSGLASVLDYYNLICLYFNCMSFGYTSAHKVDKQVEVIASTRALELIAQAITKFGQSDELTFWKFYVPYIGWGDDDDEMTIAGDSFVPYIFIAAEHPTDENLCKVKILQSEISDIFDSERKRFFLARIESILEIKK